MVEIRVLKTKAKTEEVHYLNRFLSKRIQADSGNSMRLSAKNYNEKQHDE